MTQRPRFQHLWLLFAVVAVALVWTWSQVAQNTTSPTRVESGSIELLRTEPNCDLAQGPCAAYGVDIAMVAVAQAEGQGVRWRIKLLGKQVPAVPVVALAVHSPGAKPQALTVLQVGDEWQAYSSARVLKGSVLRARLTGGQQPWVADYPLAAGP